MYVKLNTSFNINDDSRDKDTERTKNVNTIMNNNKNISLAIDGA